MLSVQQSNPHPTPACLTGNSERCTSRASDTVAQPTAANSAPACGVASCVPSRLTVSSAPASYSLGGQEGGECHS